MDECDKEPIHLPDSCQPHGVLLVLRGGRVVRQSANAGELLGSAPETLESGLAATSREMVQLAILEHRRRGVEGTTFLPGLVWQGARMPFDGSYHEVDGAGILELEPGLSACPDASARPLDVLSEAVLALESMQTVESAALEAARQIRLMSGFERTLVYRFHSDWHGEVIAEDRGSRLASFKDLHFPAADIPAQARALYVRNRSRRIADCAAIQAPLVPAGPPLDMTDCVLRTVSPIHRQYCLNMGIRASMSFSLVVAGQLWGLLSCHDPEPRPVSGSVRQAGLYLANVLSLYLARLQQQQSLLQEARQGALLTILGGRLADSHNPAELLEGHQNLRSFIPADTVLVAQEGDHRRSGDGLSPDEAARLTAWLDTQPSTLLCLEQAPSEVLSGGVLAVRLNSPEPTWIAWVRAERSRLVPWAGDPNKPRTLEPRESFARYDQVEHAVAAEWTPLERQAAADLGFWFGELLRR